MFVPVCRSRVLKLLIFFSLNRYFYFKFAISLKKFHSKPSNVSPQVHFKNKILQEKRIFYTVCLVQVRIDFF